MVMHIAGVENNGYKDIFLRRKKPMYYVTMARTCSQCASVLVILFIIYVNDINKFLKSNLILVRASSIHKLETLTDDVLQNMTTDIISKQKRC